MKTLQELYAELVDDVQKKAFADAVRAGEIDDFMREHDCQPPKRRSRSSWRRRRQRPIRPI